MLKDYEDKISGLVKQKKIAPYLKNFLTYHPTFYTPIDRSRRALQLCSGSRGEWVKSRLHFLTIHGQRVHMSPTHTVTIFTE